MKSKSLTTQPHTFASAPRRRFFNLSRRSRRPSAGKLQSTPAPSTARRSAPSAAQGKRQQRSRLPRSRGDTLPRRRPRRERRRPAPAQGSPCRGCLRRRRTKMVYAALASIACPRSTQTTGSRGSLRVPDRSLSGTRKLPRDPAPE